MKIGICGGFDLLEKAAKAGYDYLEPTVVSVADLSDIDFDTLRARVEAAPIPCEAFNVLLPSSLKVVGPEADLTTLAAYFERVMPRVSALGAQVVVFGSGGARRLPDGWEEAEGLRQYTKAAAAAAAVAERVGLTIVVEPLNRKETNLINDLDTGLAIVRQTERPGLKLLADFYHMRMENEDFAAIERAGPELFHAHIARNGDRAAPREAAEDHYAEFLARLSAVGYRGRLSVEAKIADFDSEASAALALLRSLSAGL
jgi:sugar phosphate isomerase/epimerase